jgi:hypothetical protein
MAALQVKWDLTKGAIDRGGRALLVVKIVCRVHRTEGRSDLCRRRGLGHHALGLPRRSS